MANRPPFFLLSFPVGQASYVALADNRSADERARQTEAQMIDDERFGMIHSVLGAVAVIGVKPDARIPKGVPMRAGYAQGVPRLTAQTQVGARLFGN